MAFGDERPLDTQVIELLGRNRLVSELLRAGLEVAVPARDRGIDLIAYLDLIDPQDEAKDPASAGRVQRFAARPIQMKAASQQSFFNLEEVRQAPRSHPGVRVEPRGF